MTSVTLWMRNPLMWVYAAAFLVAFFALMPYPIGLIPVLVGIGAGLVFQPPPPLHVTDAELQAWLDGSA